MACPYAIVTQVVSCMATELSLPLVVKATQVEICKGDFTTCRSYKIKKEKEKSNQTNKVN